MSERREPILITGATGFLGSWIISKLVAEGYRVVATDIVDDYSRLNTLMPDIAVEKIDTRICDVTNSTAVDMLVAETRPAAIIHLAALQIPQCRANPSAGAMVNVVGHINIFEAARKHGIERVIYTSSIAAKPRGPADAPANLYGVFKKTDEEISRLYWEDFSLPSLGLRPHIVYGVGRDEGETSAITHAIRAAAHGESFEMPFATRSCFQYAGEVAEIFYHCLQSHWQGAIVSDLTSRIESTVDVIAAIYRVVPQADIMASSIERPSPIDGLDNSPLQAIIGPWQETSLFSGVSETFNMYKKIAGASGSNEKE